MEPGRDNYRVFTSHNSRGFHDQFLGIFINLELRDHEIGNVLCAIGSIIDSAIEVKILTTDRFYRNSLTTPSFVGGS